MEAADAERRKATLVVLHGDTEVGRWPLEVPARPDLGAVDALARLQLAARRVGLTIRVDHPGADLRGLLDLVGMPGLAGPCDLPLEARRQAEEGEQLGVDEVVERRDPSV